MSAANEYPFAGDLTDPRVSGLLHNTLERLARRTAQNNTYITNINESGPEDTFSSPMGSSFCTDPNNDPSSSVLQPRYAWTVNYCCGAGRFYFYSTAIPTGTKLILQKRYRRNEVTPDAELIRETTPADIVGDVACQNKSTQIHEAVWAYFAGSVATGSYIVGEIIFNLPGNFKGFKPDGIELDIRPKATGLYSGTSVRVTTAIYKPHCTNTVSFVHAQTDSFEENTAPSGVEPVEFTADSYQFHTARFSEETLGSYWKPYDTVKLYMFCDTDDPGSYDLLSFYIGALKVNYR